MNPKSDHPLSETTTPEHGSRRVDHSFIDSHSWRVPLLYHGTFYPKGRGHDWDDSPIEHADIHRALVKLANTVTSTILSKIEGKLPKKQRSNRKSFFDLPGEVRNTIYGYVLGGQRQLVPKPFRNSDAKFHEISFLLRTSRQMFAELMPLMEKQARVYVPIARSLELNALVRQVNAEGPESMDAFGLTYLHALRSFLSLHIHFHLTHSEPRSCYHRHHVSERLQQALAIYTTASPKLALGAEGTKRQAIVHLDNYFECIGDPPGLFGVRDDFLGYEEHVALLGESSDTMSADMHTDWQIRFYVIAPCYIEEDMAKELQRHNVRPVLELTWPGTPLEWEDEIIQDGKMGDDWWLNIMKDIKPSSMLWACFPENAPWRMGK